MELLTGYFVFHWIAGWSNPVCDQLFRVVTDLGDHSVYFLVIAVLFWVVDRRRAAILFLLLLASGFSNTFIKLWVHTPRPDPGLVRILDMRPYEPLSGSFPSGHAQGALVFWGYLSLWMGQAWFTLLAALMVSLVSFSRLYLGVHFPVDILGGLSIGAIVLLFISPTLDRWSRSDFRTGFTGALAVVTAALVAVLATGDLTLALASGSLVGFFVATVWLPQVPVAFQGARQSSVGATGGVLFTLVILPVAGLLPRTPLAVGAEVAVAWIVALWLYPQLLHRVRFGRAVRIPGDARFN